MDNEVTYLKYNFFPKIKEIISNNTLYRIRDGEVPNFRPLRALSRAHGEVLTFTFAAFESKVIKTLNMQKPAPPPLEFINVEDADDTHGGHLSPIPSTVHGMYIIYVGKSLRVKEKGKHTGKMVTGSGRRKAERTGGESNDGQTSTTAGFVTMESEEVVFDVFDVSPASSMMFNEPKKDDTKYFKKL